MTAIAVVFFVLFLGLVGLGLRLLARATGEVRLHPEWLEGAVICFVMAVIFLVGAVNISMNLQSMNDEEPETKSTSDICEIACPGPVGPPGPGGPRDEETPVTEESSDETGRYDDLGTDSGYKPSYRLWVDGKTWRYW